MNIHEILHRPVENMLMTGHTDTAENIFEFMPDYNSYFFKFTDNFLKIDFYVIKMFLKDYVYSDFFIKKIILFNAVENGDSFMCDYAEVVFSDGLAVEKTLNFDPLNFWGISVDSKNEPPENAIITVIE